jgi:hypothetical protein
MLASMILKMRLLKHMWYNKHTIADSWCREGKSAWKNESNTKITGGTNNLLVYMKFFLKESIKLSKVNKMFNANITNAKMCFS